ncbi:MAG: family 16 glycosylhydrolase [Gammaproteobacteria bacterium]
MMSRLYTVFLLGCAFMSAQVVQAQCVDIPDCRLVWADEFDGDSLDLTKWEYMLGDGSQFGIPGWGNNELQYYTTNNTTVSDGVLTITAREEQIANKNYSSARLRSLGRGDWTFGRFEMRAKLPVGQGMWPAFWMLSSSPQAYGVWAASGEIDIMESTGDDPERILGTIHYGGSSPDNVFSGESTRLAAGTVDEFHEYAVEWRFGEIRWYLDGQLYGVRTNWWSTGGPFPAPFDLDFHLLLNLAVGGNLPGAPDASTVFPQEYAIDYVRVYQTPPEGTPGALVVFDDMEHGNPFGNDWFVFNGNAGSGSIGATTTDLPPADGGNAAIFASYSTGGDTGFTGGFGRTARRSLAGITEFSFWINPDADQAYTLQVNLQEDDNADGNITTPADDEFQYNCVVSPVGPCAISGGGWQRVSVPLTSFYDDNGFLTGGNGDLDADGAEELVNIVFAIIAAGNGDVSFRTDYWAFNGPADGDADMVADVQDNCLTVPNPAQRDTNNDGYGNLCDGDLNNDCVVNVTDLGALRVSFFTTNANADLNGDNVVNVLDLGILRTLFFSAPGPSGVTSDCDAP